MINKENSLLGDIEAVMIRHGWSRPASGARKSASPRFLISMLGFNNLVLSKNCIESVLECTTPGSYHLRLTNNGSKDGTREYFDQIVSQFDHVTVVHEDDNTGFQEPNEKAFSVARDMGAEFIVFLNNDATVPVGWLERLAESMDKDPKVAVAGPFGGCSRVDDQMNGCDDTKLEFIEFSCAAVRISAITTPRIFAPFLSFIYGEDLEVCLRLQYQGWKIARSSFRILHRGSQTAGAHPEAKAKCAEANARNLAAMRKHYAHWNRVRRFDHPILIKRKYAVGDVLLTTPIIRALHERMPLCPIYVETDYPELFYGNPCITGASKELPLGVTEEMRNPMVIDLNGSYEKTPQLHAIANYALAAGLDPVSVGMKLEYFAAESPPRRGLSGKWCAIHIGPTAWNGKNWPVDRWNAVAQALRKQGWKILLLGSPPKRADVLVDLDMRGQSGYPELAGLLSQCELFLGVDSFPAHMAAAVGVPCVVLYGITLSSCFAAYTKKYIAVQSDPSHPDTGRRNREPDVTFIHTDDSVMQTISVDRVLQAVEEIQS